MLSWGPNYEIRRNGQLMVVVKNKLFAFLTCEFTVEVHDDDLLVLCSPVVIDLVCHDGAD